MLSSGFRTLLYPASCMTKDTSAAEFAQTVSKGPCEGLGGPLTDSGLPVGLPEPDDLIHL